MSQGGLTVEKVTNLFLYGQEAAPADKNSDSLIRPAAQSTPANVDTASYMASSGGRFASPALFDLFQLFFTAPHVQLSPGSYTKEQLATIYGLNGPDALDLSIRQVNFDDDQGDYAERVYIYNSG
jgi:hypothetical protein